MADKLVVEFHGLTREPFVVLVLHGGDNPVSASLTLTAFLANIQGAIQGSDMNAGELASRFIVSHASLNIRREEHPELDAFLIGPAEDYGYQLCRLYVTSGHVRAVVVLDQYSNAAEVQEATALWDVTGIAVKFLNLIDSAL